MRIPTSPGVHELCRLNATSNLGIIPSSTAYEYVNLLVQAFVAIAAIILRDDSYIEAQRREGNQPRGLLIRN
jgi:hypothetical protein